MLPTQMIFCILFRLYAGWSLARPQPMNLVHGEAVKGRVVLRESNVKFVEIRIAQVSVSAREPEGVGWAPGDGTYK